MYISKKLLTKINPIFGQINDREFEQLCNRVGIEVETVMHHHEMHNLQIAYLEEVCKHPNAEKLNVAQVRLSKDKVVTVVCGAANIKAGVYAIYAPIGTPFLDGRIIESKNIRGVDSYGMLCGHSELTTIGKEMLSDEDADGIILLDKAVLGDTDIGSYIDNDDVIYDLSIPSNRNDLNAAVLLAHELIVGLKKHSDLPIEIKQLKASTHEPSIDSKVCSDFGLIYIPKITNYKPTWTEKQLLMSCGLKVHDNWLDLLNIFTIKFGNPTHIYNADHFDVKDFNVKLTKEDQVVIGLDKQEYKIPKNTIGVFSKDTLLNVAGMLGLDNSKYSTDLKSVIIEVGHFDAVKIKQASQATKIQTKAQAFFSKPYSSWITQNTYLKICEYLKLNNIDFECHYKFTKTTSKSIDLDLQAAKTFIGVNEISTDGYYGFDKNKYIAHPTRIDINNVYDVYEEIMKFVDINELVERPIDFQINSFDINSHYIGIKTLRTFLINAGLMEVKTYNLAATTNAEKFNFFEHKESFKLANPISKNREVLRKSAIDELLKIVQYNLARKRELFNIFEVQTIVESHTISNSHLTMLFTVPLIDNKISHANIDLNLLNLKSLLINLFKQLNHNITLNEVDHLNVLEVYQEHSFKVLLNNHCIGYISPIKQSVLKTYDINQPAYVVDVKLVPEIFTSNLHGLTRVSEFPVVYRDINIKTNDQKQINNQLSKIRTVDFVSDCWVNDVYHKEDQSTYTITVKISDLQKTMTDEMIKNVLAEIDKTLSA